MLYSGKGVKQKKVNIRNSVVLITWLILGTSSSMFVMIDSNNYYKNSIIYLGIILILHSFIYFIKHGGRYITPSGMFFLYSALIHGFSSVYIAFTGFFNVEMGQGHFIGLLLIYFSQIIVYHLFSTHTASEKNYQANFSNINLRQSYYGLVALLLIAVFTISVMVLDLSTLKEAVFYFVLIFITVNIAFKKESIGIRKIILVFTLFFLYYTFAFSGFGRINIATLLVTISMILQFKIKKKYLKSIVVLSFVPLIMIASLMRGGTVGDINSGLYSIISPFYRMGQIIQLYIDGNLGLSFGQTIYAALVVLIPRNIWPSKPWNFNRQITYIFAPQYISAGHSEASVFMAELVYNFGILFSLVVSILIIGLVLSYLDKMFIFSFKRINWGIKNIIIFTIISIASAGSMNLLWGGFSTYINRDGFRILFGLFFLLIVNILNNGMKEKVESIN